MSRFLAFSSLLNCFYIFICKGVRTSCIVFHPPNFLVFLNWRWKYSCFFQFCYYCVAVFVLSYILNSCFLTWLRNHVQITVTRVTKNKYTLGSMPSTAVLRFFKRYLKTNQPFEIMVEFSSGPEILAKIKCKSENKGLIQASWLSPDLCRRSFPVACL